MAVFLQEREELEFPKKGADLTRINCKFLNKHLETKWGLKVGLPGRSGVILLLSKAMPGDGGNARWRVPAFASSRAPRTRGARTPQHRAGNVSDIWIVK